MDLTVNDAFIELCANEYFNSYTDNGIPVHQKYTFIEYVHMRAKQVI